MTSIPFFIDTQPSDGGPEELGTAEYIGGGVFLTAAHLFQYYRNGILLSTDSGQLEGPVGAVNFSESDFKVYPSYDASFSLSAWNWE